MSVPSDDSPPPAQPEPRTASVAVGGTPDIAPTPDAGTRPHIGVEPLPSLSSSSESITSCEPPQSNVPVPTKNSHEATASIPVPIPAIRNVLELDWIAVRHAVDAPTIRSRMRGIVEAMEALLDRASGPELLFDHYRAHPGDQAIRVGPVNLIEPLWIIGDLHGDLLALEAALAAIKQQMGSDNVALPRIIFLGDFFDDGGYGLEVLLRVFELVLESPDRVCVIAGNHDEALSYNGVQFTSDVSPSDFADFLNVNLTHEWIERTGKIAIRLFAHAPRALFFPDGLLVAHAGFPLTDLHARIAATGNWNDPACLSDFVWTRAHPTARRKLPNRFSRGSQYGYEDFAAFCELSARLGRPITHMVRGHDHVEERYAIYPAYKIYPMLTTVALSRRLPREAFGPPDRVPTLARVIEGSLPQVYRIQIPAGMVNEVYPELRTLEGSEEPSSQEALT
jgi:hypothetical protein